MYFFGLLSQPEKKTQKFVPVHWDKFGKQNCSR